MIASAIRIWFASVMLTTTNSVAFRSKQGRPNAADRESSHRAAAHVVGLFQAATVLVQPQLNGANQLSLTLRNTNLGQYSPIGLTRSPRVRAVIAAWSSAKAGRTITCMRASYVLEALT